MGKFWTWKVVALAAGWWLLQLGSLELSVGEPPLLAAELVGAALGALALVALCKLLYVGVSRLASAGKEIATPS